MANLKELRDQWEQGLELVSEFQPEREYNGQFIAILKSPESEDRPAIYHFHRYFSFGDQWQVSVDKRGNCEAMLIELQRLFPFFPVDKEKINAV